MDFKRYIRFYREGVLVDPSTWGVNTFPDGQNQFWFAPEEDDEDEDAMPVRVDVSATNPAVLDLLIQIAAARRLERVRVLYKYGARCDKTTNGTVSTANVAKIYTRILSGLHLFVEYLVPHDHGCVDMAYIPPIHLPAYDAIIFPDKSARHRQGWLRGMESVEAVKVRDQETGRITKFTLPDLDCNKRYLVVDDICDGGATFDKIADAAEEAGLPYANLELYITHGVLSGEAFRVLKRYNHTFMTNSYVQPESNILSQFFEDTFTQPVTSLNIRTNSLTVFNVWGLE